MPFFVNDSMHILKERVPFVKPDSCRKTLYYFLGFVCGYFNVENAIVSRSNGWLPTVFEHAFCKLILLVVLSEVKMFCRGDFRPN